MNRGCVVTLGLKMMEIDRKNGIDGSKIPNYLNDTAKKSRSLLRKMSCSDAIKKIIAENLGEK